MRWPTRKKLLRLRGDHSEFEGVDYTLLLFNSVKSTKLLYWPIAKTLWWINLNSSEASLFKWMPSEGKQPPPRHQLLGQRAVEDQ